MQGKMKKQKEVEKNLDYLDTSKNDKRLGIDKNKTTTSIKMISIFILVFIFYGFPIFTFINIGWDKLITPYLFFIGVFLLIINFLKVK